MNRFVVASVGFFLVLAAGYGLSHVFAQSNRRPEVQSVISKLHDGDIVFQPNEAGQGRAIQLATGSKYSHCGVVFFQKGKPYVLEAVQPVKLTPFLMWIRQGDEGEYAVKRLRSADRILTPGIILKMKSEGKKMLGKNYDLKFGWGDDRLYCSELVWNVSNRTTGLAVGPLKKLDEFRLSNPIVQEIMKKRFGRNIPLHQKMIAPGDIFDSDLLETVAIVD
jgi:hypothetical protein